MYQKSLQIKYCTHVKYSLLSKKKKLVKTSLFKLNFSTDYIFNYQKKKKLMTTELYINAGNCNVKHFSFPRSVYDELYI